MNCPLAIRGLHHIALVTHSTETSAAFYRELLGFRELPRPPFQFAGAWLFNYGVQIHLIEDPAFQPVLEGPIQSRLNHLAFSVANIDQVRSALTERGISYLERLNAAGVEQIFFRDPSGHFIELAVYGSPAEGWSATEGKLMENLQPLADPPEPAAATLQQALHSYDFRLSAGQIEQLERYCQLLWRINERINLTRHTDYRTFVSRDLMDSWQLAKHLQPGERILDVGTGGGVPGVILSVLRPDLQVTVCESIGKKAMAVEEIIEQLGVAVRVEARRAEQILETMAFDCLVARAVGPLAKILKWFVGRWDAIGRMLLIKGPRWTEERGEARHRGLLRDLELRRIDEYAMVGTESTSVILLLWKKGAPVAGLPES